MRRPYEGHNPAANEVLRTGEVWVTSEPFSSRRDAKMAESLLIRIAKWATESRPRLTNRAEVESSKLIIPALPYRQGVLRYDALSRALIVMITPESLGYRASPTGEADEIALTRRCNRWWGLAQAVRQRKEVQLLVAITARVKPTRVIGAWETHSVTEWWRERIVDNQGRELLTRKWANEPWNGPDPYCTASEKRDWVVAVKSTNSDQRGYKGLRFEWGGYSPQGIGWSKDLRT